MHIVRLRFKQLHLETTSIDGCTDSYHKSITVFRVDTEEQHPMSSLKVFPNPVSKDGDVINIHYQFEGSKDLTIEIFNTLGQRLYEKHLPQATNLAQQIDLSAYTGGVYFVKVTADNTFITKRIIVNK